jgi:hypothetical protein
VLSIRRDLIISLAPCKREGESVAGCIHERDRTLHPKGRVIT